MARRFALASIVMALAAVCVQCAVAQQKTKQPEHITGTELKKKLDSGQKFLLIDVREDWEIKAEGAIPGAIHIPMGDLDSRMKDIPKDVQLIFY